MTAKRKQDIGYSEDTRLALLEQSIGHINETLMRFEKRFDQIDERFDRIDRKFDGVDSKFAGVDGKFDGMDRKFDSMDRKFDGIDSKIDSNFKWLLGMMVAGFGSLFGVIAHGFHWL